MRFVNGGSSGSATTYTVTLGLGRMTPLHLSFTGRATRYQNSTLDGTILTGRLGADPWPAVHVDLNGGLRNGNVPLADPMHRNIS